MSSILVESTSVEERVAVFSALADPTRLRILDALGGDVRCVCELQAALPEVAANLLSYHLRILREADLIRAERRGRWVDYTVSPTARESVAVALPGVFSEA